MIGWLSGLLGFVSGALRTLWDDLINVIKNVDGFLERRISQIQVQVNALIAGEWGLSLFINRFIVQSFDTFVRWTENRTDTIINAVNRNYTIQQQQNSDTRSFASALAGAAESLARTLFGGLTKWIISTIFGPLSHDIASALGWILKEGAFILDLVTHPEKLFSLLFKFIFGAWVQLLVKFGPMVFAYGLRHWKTIMPVVLTVIEDIIANVL